MGNNCENPPLSRMTSQTSFLQNERLEGAILKADFQELV